MTKPYNARQLRSLLMASIDTANKLLVKIPYQAHSKNPIKIDTSNYEDYLCGLRVGDDVYTLEESKKLVRILAEFYEVGGEE